MQLRDPPLRAMNLQVRIGCPSGVVCCPVYGGFFSSMYSLAREPEDLPPHMPHVRIVKRRERIGTSVLPRAVRRMKLTTSTTHMTTCVQGGVSSCTHSAGPKRGGGGGGGSSSGVVVCA